jgi:hypothetical protein
MQPKRLLQYSQENLMNHNLSQLNPNDTFTIYLTNNVSILYSGGACFESRLECLLS